MKGKLLKIFIAGLAVLPLLAFAQPKPPAPQPKPPRPPAHRPAPPPPPPRFHPAGPPHGGWFAVGGISYMFGSAIRAYERPSTTIVYTQSTPQTVVYTQPAPKTIIIQQPAQDTVSRASLKADIAGLLNEQLKGVPCAVEVDDFYLSSGNYAATITATCTLNGTNYSITASALQSGYDNLKNKIVGDIVSAINRANSNAQGESVKIRQIP